ncbi:hypothetical protein BHM03_00007542 [Ensete ventricosum]|nr:hypothetical protein BHM03_00007542 [Ensete ventricosum]
MVPARSAAETGQVRAFGDTDPGEISMPYVAPGSAGRERGQEDRGSTESKNRKRSIYKRWSRRGTGDKLNTVHCVILVGRSVSISAEELNVFCYKKTDNNQIARLEVQHKSIELKDHTQDFLGLFLANELGRREDYPGEEEKANGHEIGGGTRQSPKASRRLWSAATDEVKRGQRKRPWKARKRQQSSKALALEPFHLRLERRC